MVMTFLSSDTSGMDGAEEAEIEKAIESQLDLIDLNECESLEENDSLPLEGEEDDADDFVDSLWSGINDRSKAFFVHCEDHIESADQSKSQPYEEFLKKALGEKGLELNEFELTLKKVAKEEDEEIPDQTQPDLPAVEESIEIHSVSEIQTEDNSEIIVDSDPVTSMDEENLSLVDPVEDQPQDVVDDNQNASVPRENPKCKIIEAWLETDEGIDRLHEERWSEYSSYMDRADSAMAVRREHGRSVMEKEIELEKAKQEKFESEFREKDKQISRQHEEELENEKRRLAEISKQVEEERERYMLLQKQKMEAEAARRNAAAIIIQRCYRGSHARHLYGTEVKERMAQARRKLENDKIIALEKERKRQKALELDKKRKQEDKKGKENDEKPQSSRRDTKPKESGLADQTSEKKKVSEDVTTDKKEISSKNNEKISKETKPKSDCKNEKAETGEVTAARKHSAGKQEGKQEVSNVAKESDYENKSKSTDTVKAESNANKEVNNDAVSNKENDQKNFPPPEKGSIASKVTSESTPLMPQVKEASKQHEGNARKAEVKSSGGTTDRKSRDVVRESVDQLSTPVPTKTDSESSQKQASDPLPKNGDAIPESTSHVEVHTTTLYKKVVYEKKTYDIKDEKASSEAKGHENEGEKDKNDREDKVQTENEQKKVEKNDVAPKKERLGENVSAGVIREKVEEKNGGQEGREDSKAATSDTNADAGKATHSPSELTEDSLAKASEEASKTKCKENGIPGPPHPSASVAEDKQRIDESNSVIPKTEEKDRKKRVKTSEVVTNNHKDGDETTKQRPSSFEKRRDIKLEDKSEKMATGTSQKLGKVTDENVVVSGGCESCRINQSSSLEAWRNKNRGKFSNQLKEATSTRDAASSKTKLRPPRAIRTCPALSKDVIQRCVETSGLKEPSEITCLQLADLPSSVRVSSLSTLCPQLTTLIMPRCHLIAIEGLEQCPNLEYVDVKDNQIEFLHFPNHQTLIHLDVSLNKLKSIHGLTACSSLMSLNLNYNQITKIGGLEGCPRLQALHASHNELMSCDGVSLCPYLQFVDLSFNHISSIACVNELPLLRSLNLSDNDIMEIPVFSNVPLLQYLNLSKNDISSLNGLSQSWLPSLRSLDLGSNNIMELGKLHLPLLQKIELKINIISDLHQLISSLEAFSLLTNIGVDENPCFASPSAKDTLLHSLKDLETLNGQLIPNRRHVEPIFDDPYTENCHMYAQEFENRQSRFTKRIQNLLGNPDIDYKSVIHSSRRYYQQSETLAIRHRHFHEGMEDVSETDVSSVQQIKEKATTDNSNAVVIQEEKTPIIEDKKQESNSLEMVYQRMEMENSEEFEKRVRTITFLQAVWRGCRTRRMIQQALAYADTNGLPTDDDLTQEFAEMEDFNFAEWDEEQLEKLFSSTYMPPPTPNLPPLSSRRSLPNVRDVPEPRSHVTPEERNSAGPKGPTKTAWGHGSAVSQVPIVPPITSRPDSSMSGRRTETIIDHADDSYREEMLSLNSSRFAKKKDKIMEDWGFKDEKCAVAMFERAKKIKYDPERRARLSKMSAQQRFMLFKKLETVSKHQVVTPKKHEGIKKQEYFKGIAMQQAQATAEIKKEEAARVSRTFEWVFNQPVNLEQSITSNAETRRPLADENRPSRTTNLPKIERGNRLISKGPEREPSSGSSRFSSAGQRGSCELPPIFPRRVIPDD